MTITLAVRTWFLAAMNSNTSMLLKNTEFLFRRFQRLPGRNYIPFRMVAARSFEKCMSFFIHTLLRSLRR